MKETQEDITTLIQFTEVLPLTEKKNQQTAIINIQLELNGTMKVAYEFSRELKASYPIKLILF